MDTVANGTYPADGFNFLNEMVESITETMKDATFGAYYGYVDPELTPREAHRAYWLDHYKRLANIKKVVDPKKVFSNPQAVLST